MATLALTQVFAELRAEKNVIARELQTAAYHVAQNRALMSMARAVPASLEELLGCWGWGEAKVAAHGARLLAVLQARTCTCALLVHTLHMDMEHGTRTCMCTCTCNMHMHMHMHTHMHTHMHMHCASMH